MEISLFPKEKPIFIHFQNIKLIRWILMKGLRCHTEAYYQQLSVWFNLILCLLIQANHFIRLIDY